MRIEIPGPGSHWVELRDPDSLTAADDDAWRNVIQEAWAKKAAEEADADADEEGEGVPKPKLRLTADMLAQRRDALFASLILDWSYAAEGAVPHIPLPYSAESRKLLPLTAGKTLNEATKPHIAALDGPAGPKEPEPKTSTTDGSGSDSG
jgi:hypothetical protein